MFGNTSGFISYDFHRASKGPLQCYKVHAQRNVKVKSPFIDYSSVFGRGMRSDARDDGSDTEPDDDDCLLDRSSDGLALAGVAKKAPLMIRSFFLSVEQFQDMFAKTKDGKHTSRLSCPYIEYVKDMDLVPFTVTI